jgi:hypothetical protein
LLRFLGRAGVLLRMRLFIDWDRHELDVPDPNPK